MVELPAGGRRRRQCHLIAVDVCGVARVTLLPLSAGSMPTVRLYSSCEKVAVTVVSRLRFTVQGVVPVQLLPIQPAKVTGSTTPIVSTTSVP